MKVDFYIDYLYRIEIGLTREKYEESYIALLKKCLIEVNEALIY